jgi:hypothetical protein
MSIFKKDPAKDAATAQNQAAPQTQAQTVDADRVAAAAAAAVTQMLNQPRLNQAAIDEARARQRRPKDDTRAFRVHVRGGLTRKRRAGIEWTTDPQTVNAEDLTEDQAIRLLNTPHLYVEELSSTSKDAVKPNQQTGPSPDQLRAPGDAPVPTPTESPGRLGVGATLGGMTVVEAPATQQQARTATRQATADKGTTDKG